MLAFTTVIIGTLAAPSNNVHAAIGKQSFDTAKLVDNAQAFIDTITKMKPSSTKGHYVKKISLSGTMTPGVQVAV